MDVESQQTIDEAIQRLDQTLKDRLVDVRNILQATVTQLFTNVDQQLKSLHYEIQFSPITITIPTIHIKRHV